MPVPSVELTLSARSDASVRRVWAALTDAGLPSQDRHRGPSNAPHVTVAAGGAIGEPHRLAGMWQPLLPRIVPTAGVVVFGRHRYTVAYLLAAAGDLTAAASTARIAAGAPGPAWVPHVTLARRVSGAELGPVLTVAAELDPGAIELDGLRHWDPATRAVDVLVPAALAGGSDPPAGGTGHPSVTR